MAIIPFIVPLVLMCVVCVCVCEHPRLSVCPGASVDMEISLGTMSVVILTGTDL